MSSKVKVEFRGPNVEGVAAMDVAVPADPLQNVVWLQLQGTDWSFGLAGRAGNQRPGRRLIEQEPNNEPAKANRVPVPGGITGRFRQSGETSISMYSPPRKARSWLSSAHAGAVFATLVYMILKNSETEAEIAKSNPQARLRAINV